MFTLIVLSCLLPTTCIEDHSPADYITEERCFAQGAILAGMNRVEFGRIGWDFSIEHTLICTDQFGEQIVRKHTDLVDKSLGF